MASRATLLSYFETGDMPTQAQFAELINSLRLLDEALATTDIAGLTALIEQVVDARIGGVNQRQFQVLEDPGTGSKVITVDGQPIGEIGQASEQAPGLINQQFYTKLRDIDPSAEPNRTTAQLAEDLRNYDQLRIPARAIEGLPDPTPVALSVSQARTYEVPADTVVKTFFITPGEDGEIRIGLTPGGDELIGREGVKGVPFSVDFNGLFENNTTLYLTGNFSTKFKTESYA
jgi:hypothetical protein